MELYLQMQFFGNPLFLYVKASVFFLVVFVVLKIVHFFVSKHAVAISEKTNTSIDDFFVSAFSSLFMPIGVVFDLYASIRLLTVTESVMMAVNVISVAVLTIIAAHFFSSLMTYGFDVYKRKRGKDDSFERSMNGIKRIIKFAIWVLAICFFLDNLGINISALVTGLGIGGVAVALAAQAVLGDLFSYFSILFDRPFDVGDFVITQDYMGVVESIGIKTTRIRSLGGEQLIFSNTDLTSSRLRNYKRMEKRRVVFRLGVIYSTPYDKLQKIPELIKDVICSIEDTTFDRAHFYSYGASSLDFEIVYYVLSGDYNKYMDIQQAINLEIFRRFSDLGVEFAYPTQTLYVNHEPPVNVETAE